MKSEESLASVLLVSRLVADGVQPLKASEYWQLCEQVGKTSALLGQSEQQLVSDHGLTSELASRVVALLERATAMAFELERLDQTGIATLTATDEGYPTRLIERLGSKAPPVLHAAGDVELLQQPGLGVVGSRGVTEEGAEVARSAAARGVRGGLPLVSGGARGVDQLAMNSAYEAEGSVVGFLADSLVRTLKAADVRRAIHQGSTVLCTPYSPAAPFSAGNAMGRNKLIYAQSLVTLVVASDHEKGGTWSGAIEAIKGSFGRVAVWRGEGEGPGNAAIERRGATPISSIDELEPLFAGDEPEPAAAPLVTQPSLFAFDAGQEPGSL